MAGKFCQLTMWNVARFMHAREVVVPGAAVAAHAAREGMPLSVCFSMTCEVVSTTRFRWHAFESSFKPQVPAALSCQFEPGDLVLHVTHERNMEREPHSPNKLVTNRSLYQRYVAV